VSQGVFVTAIDTDAGKTVVSAGLVEAWRAQGKTVAVMKPVASGCDRTDQGLRNDDARRLIAASASTVPYRLVNPYAFEAPVAPHIAAHSDGTEIEMAVIESAFEQLQATADRVVVEGVGGWMVPINASQTMADVAKTLGLPVVLLPLCGWVANRLDSECLQLEENIAALKERLDAPLLVDLPLEQDEAALMRHMRHINMESLVG
jgi:dethiobiotin synthetase